MLEIIRKGMYAGAQAYSFQSADGWVYFVFIGDGPDGFAAYVYKQKDGVQQRVPLPYFSTARPTADLEPDGLYVTLFRQGDSGLVRVKVPGFIPFTTSSDGETPIPVPTPTEAVDHIARGDIASLRIRIDELNKRLTGEANGIWNAIINDRKNVKLLSDKVSLIVSGITRDEAWQLALDAQYWGVTAPESDARKEMIKLIIGTKNYVGLSEEVKELIAVEVEKAIDAITTKVVAALQN